MKLDINLEGIPLPVSQPFVDVLHQQLTHFNPTEDTEYPLLGLVINFKDTSYNIEDGGYHPIQIGMNYANGQCTLDYITDFAWVGGPFPELAKEVDFNLSDNVLYTMFGGPFPLDSPDTKDFYQTWESNFTEYVSSGCFDQIEVTQVC